MVCATSRGFYGLMAAALSTKARRRDLVVNRKNDNNQNYEEGAAIVAVLKACTQQKNLVSGSRVHADILKGGFLLKNSYIAVSLVNMYAKCGDLGKAEQVLEELPVRDVVAWNALITGYAQEGKSEDAFKSFAQMQIEGVPDKVSYICTLKACGSMGAASKGEEIHKEIMKKELLSNDIVLGTTLVDMYVKCGALAKAAWVLDELSVQDTVCWTALIAGYAQQGLAQEALKCFECMQGRGYSPNSLTFTCVLKACGSLGAVDIGERIHREIMKLGWLKRDAILKNSLVDMYVKCNALVKAAQVLHELSVKDIVAWNALISGYAQQGQDEEAVKCFMQMQNEGISPDTATLSCILKICGSIGASDEGQAIHNKIARGGLLDDIVLGTALVDMYAKCDAFAKATQVLDELPFQSVSIWNALIAGYVQQDQGEEALRCFEELQNEGFSPDTVTFTCTLRACGSIGALNKGEEIHNEILRQRLLCEDVILGNTLLNMYAKCGAITKAASVLGVLSVRNLISWNTLIAGYVQQGLLEEALVCFKLMQSEDLFPDIITLVHVLCACSCQGLLEEGEKHFFEMSTQHGILPDLQHYTCMVDLCARAGEFEKALRLIKKMPATNHLPLWLALLGACRESGYVKLGRLAFENAVALDKSDSSAYDLMNKIYAAAAMEQDVNIMKAR